MNTAYNGAGGTVISGDAVKGGYFVTDTIANIPSWANVKGTLCYCTGTTSSPVNKFYQYNGSSWVETLADYVLPTATATIKGGIMVGSHLTMTNDTLSVNPNFGTDTTVSAGSFNALSDIRLKENFEPLVVEKSILDLPTYKFDFIDGLKNQIGCKAQDLLEICPEIVHEGKDGYLSIQESKIVYLLLDEIKKLRKEVDALKASR
jgi:hypothetical protein